MTLLLTNQPSIDTFNAGVNTSLFYASGCWLLSLGATRKGSEQSRGLHLNQWRSDYFLRPCSTPQGKGGTHISSFTVLGTGDLVIHSRKDTVPNILCLYLGLCVHNSKSFLRLFTTLQGTFTCVSSGVSQGEKKPPNLRSLLPPFYR